jgi:two-component system phosphate regulon response regulator PhoB
MAKIILIIEDDPDIMDIMTYILREEGYQVFPSLTNVSRDYISELSPSLILMDNRLAAGYGRDFCRKLKDDPSTRHFPVVLVSAVNDLAALADHSGAGGYLNKPFDLAELLNMVRSFC